MLLRNLLFFFYLYYIQYISVQTEHFSYFRSINTGDGKIKLTRIVNPILRKKQGKGALDRIKITRFTNEN